MEPTLSPGTVLDGTYRLVEIIGRGGMGEVWRARHERLPKEVAVKLLLQVAVSGSTSVARFRREAEIASRLAHPNIVEVLDFNLLPGGIPYMVLELLVGESLRDRIQRGPIDLTETAHLVRQVSLALAAAHAQGVVHRDLKPENIFLVTEPGETGPTIRAKVLDFGISKIVGDTVLTMDREVLGTPFYMAPEQAAGKRDEVDGRADQFALACIAYEMLTGRLPFYGQTIMEILGAILHGEPDPIENLVPALPDTTVQAVHRALSKKPSERFATIGEFAEAFCSFQNMSTRPIEPDGQTAPTMALGSGNAVSARLPQAASQQSSPVATGPTTANSTGTAPADNRSQAGALARTLPSQDLVSAQTVMAEGEDHVANQTSPSSGESAPESQSDAPVLVPTEAAVRPAGHPKILWGAGILLLVGTITILAVWILTKHGKQQDHEAGKSRPQAAARPLPPRDAGAKSTTNIHQDAGPAQAGPRTSHGAVPGGDAGLQGNDVPGRKRDTGPTSGGRRGSTGARRVGNPARARSSPRDNPRTTTTTTKPGGDPVKQAQFRKAMSEARAALRNGKWAHAYSLTRRARQFGTSAELWEIRAKAACGWHDITKARAALRNVSGRRKARVKRYCAKHGMSL